MFTLTRSLKIFDERTCVCLCVCVCARICVCMCVTACVYYADSWRWPPAHRGQMWIMTLCCRLCLLIFHLINIQPTFIVSSSRVDVRFRQKKSLCSSTRRKTSEVNMVFLKWTGVITIVKRLPSIRCQDSNTRNETRDYKRSTDKI